MTEKDVKEIFANNIHKFRKNKNLTQKELGEELGLGKTTISQWESAQKLPNAGSIEKIAAYFNVPKSVLFEDSNNQFASLEKLINLPVVGKVSCGNGTIVIDEIEGYEPTPEEWVQGGEFFYLRAQGDSMIDARIQDGDLVLIRRQNEVENGEIAAVLYNDELFLKRVYIEDNGTMVLQSANSKYGPIVPRTDEDNNAVIVGKLKKVVINF